MHSFSRSAVRALAGVLVVAALGACGGGGDDSPETATQVGNSAPTIQGQPARSAVVGQSYSFQPSASDPNGDRLTFSASNLPSWASFDTATGRVSGTPTDIATFNGITITVSDGQASASLTPFSIAVAAVGIGTAVLSWDAPTQNQDGSALTDLAGFRILYGRSASDLDQAIVLDNPSLSTYMVENLGSGTWYFAVIAVNGGGISSPQSAIGSKTIS